MGQRTLMIPGALGKHHFKRVVLLTLPSNQEALQHHASPLIQPQLTLQQQVKQRKTFQNGRRQCLREEGKIRKGKKKNRSTEFWLHTWHYTTFLLCKQII